MLGQVRINREGSEPTVVTLHDDLSWEVQGDARAAQLIDAIDLPEDGRVFPPGAAALAELARITDGVLEIVEQSPPEDGVVY